METHIETAIGPCQLSWTESGICSFRLPLAPHPPRPVAADAALDQRARPDWVSDAVLRIANHLLGDPDTFRDIPLDLSGSSAFFRRVFEATRAIPPGRTQTYRELATAAGSPRAARAAGQAMARNPIPLIIPCHRVVAAGGRPGGFSAPGALNTKALLLAIEGHRLLLDEPLPFHDQTDTPVPFSTFCDNGGTKRHDHP